LNTSQCHTGCLSQYVEKERWDTSEQAASLINSTLLAPFQIPLRHISEVIRTAQTPGGVDDVEPRFEIPWSGRFSTKENSRVSTVRFRDVGLCFCLFASLRVVRVVLKMSIRRAFDGVAVRRGNRVSTSLLLTLKAWRRYFVGEITPFFRSRRRHWINFSRSSRDKLAWCWKSILAIWSGNPSVVSG
jgi:hypothetical protein